MVLESFELNKKVFVDPNNATSTFYSHHDYNKNFFKELMMNLVQELKKV